MLQISMRLNEERELKQSLVGFSLLKRFSPKTSFSPSLVRGAWNFSLSNRLILVRLNLVSWIQAPPNSVDQVEVDDVPRDDQENRRAHCLTLRAEYSCTLLGDLFRC
jgi:hypothetical protein